MIDGNELKKNIKTKESWHDLDKDFRHLKYAIHH
jgi:hypothetical protein